jgi:hypothetical protein
MRPLDLLAELGRRALPPLAGALARLGRGARRLWAFIVVALFAVVAVTVVAVWRAGHGPVSDVTVSESVRVGVPDGGSIPEYEAGNRTKLAGLVGASPSTEVYALVTLRAYLPPERLTPVLGSVAVSRVYSRVPLPGVQTQIVRIDAFRVPDDVTAGMNDVARRKDAEATDYARLAANLGGQGEKERELRVVYTSGQQIAAAEATAYRERCSCVYAAVVRATPAALDQLARRDEVRTVDPAPEVRRLDRAVFLPPLPEQRDRVVPPDSSPPPTATPTAP